MTFQRTMDALGPLRVTIETFHIMVWIPESHEVPELFGDTDIPRGINYPSIISGLEGHILACEIFTWMNPHPIRTTHHTYTPHTPYPWKLHNLRGSWQFRETFIFYSTMSPPLRGSGIQRGLLEQHWERIHAKVFPSVGWPGLRKHSNWGRGRANEVHTDLKSKDDTFFFLPKKDFFECVLLVRRQGCGQLWHVGTPKEA